jgi:oligopeptide transport system ATP-binding protein
MEAVQSREEVSMYGPLLEVKDLKKYFPVQSRIFFKTSEYVYAVDGISFNLEKGETLGIVGESGCGKSTTGRLILRLLEPTEGEVKFKGIPIFDLNKKQMGAIRREMQIIFQDPFASLNPRMSAESIVGEPLEIHGIAKGLEKEDQIVDILKKVGLKPDDMKRYPHEFSGGQRQRIGIARAIILNPKLVIADEPVSALDVSIQAQVINLLDDLQKNLDLSYIIIAHDLSVVEHCSNRIAVMYLGKIVELTTDKDLYNTPQHPYTEALLSAVPIPDYQIKKKKIILKGDIPNPIDPPSGCRFHTRCMYKMDICQAEEPELRNHGNDHWVACWLR